jgi:hypothetical protein
VRAQVFLEASQEIQVVIALEEDRLAVVAAVVKVIILVREEGDGSAGHVSPF